MVKLFVSVENDPVCRLSSKRWNWVTLLSRNTSRNGSMLENVGPESVFCHAALHDGETCWKM